MAIVIVSIHGQAVADIGRNQIMTTEPATNGDQLPELIVVDRFRCSSTGFRHAVTVSIRIQDLTCGFNNEAEAEPCRWYEVRADSSGWDIGHSE